MTAVGCEQPSTAAVESELGVSFECGEGGREEKQSVVQRLMRPGEWLSRGWLSSLLGTTPGGALGGVLGGGPRRAEIGEKRLTYLRNEIERRPSTLAEPVGGRRFHCYCSPRNSGAAELMAEVASARRIHVRVTTDFREMNGHRLGSNQLDLAG